MRRATPSDEGKPTLGNGACVAHLEINVQTGIDDANEQDAYEKNSGGRRDWMIEL